MDWELIFWLGKLWFVYTWCICLFFGLILCYYVYMKVLDFGVLVYIWGLLILITTLLVIYLLWFNWFGVLIIFLNWFACDLYYLWYFLLVLNEPYFGLSEEQVPVRNISSQMLRLIKLHVEGIHRIFLFFSYMLY